MCMQQRRKKMRVAETSFIFKNTLCLRGFSQRLVFCQFLPRQFSTRLVFGGFLWEAWNSGGLPVDRSTCRPVWPCTPVITTTWVHFWTYVKRCTFKNTCSLKFIMKVTYTFKLRCTFKKSLLKVRWLKVQNTRDWKSTLNFKVQQRFFKSTV